MLIRSWGGESHFTRPAVTFGTHPNHPSGSSKNLFSGLKNNVRGRPLIIWGWGRGGDFPRPRQSSPKVERILVRNKGRWAHFNVKLHISSRFCPTPPPRWLMVHPSSEWGRWLIDTCNLGYFGNHPNQLSSQQWLQGSFKHLKVLQENSILMGKTAIKCPDIWIQKVKENIFSKW